MQNDEDMLPGFAPPGPGRFGWSALDPEGKGTNHALRNGPAPVPGLGPPKLAAFDLSSDSNPVSVTQPRRANGAKAHPPGPHGTTQRDDLLNWRSTAAGGHTLTASWSGSDFLPESQAENGDGASVDSTNANFTWLLHETKLGERYSRVEAAIVKAKNPFADYRVDLTLPPASLPIAIQTAFPEFSDLTCAQLRSVMLAAQATLFHAFLALYAGKCLSSGEYKKIGEIFGLADALVECGVACVAGDVDCLIAQAGKLLKCPGAVDSVEFIACVLKALSDGTSLSKPAPFDCSAKRPVYVGKNFPYCNAMIGAWTVWKNQAAQGAAKPNCSPNKAPVTEAEVTSSVIQKLGLPLQGTAAGSPLSVAWWTLRKAFAFLLLKGCNVEDIAANHGYIPITTADLARFSVLSPAGCQIDSCKWVANELSNGDPLLGQAVANYCAQP